MPASIPELFAATATALRSAAPLPPLLVTIDLVEHGDAVVVCTVPGVAPARRQVALRRFAKRNRALVGKGSSGPVAEAKVGGVFVIMGDPHDGGTWQGQGRTDEHADLLDQLAGWAQDLPALGAIAVELAEAQVSDVDRDHHLTVTVDVPPEHLATALSHLAITRKRGVGGVWGVGVAPTGHQLVVRDPLPQPHQRP
jgi:hypothetical protein